MRKKLAAVFLVLLISAGVIIGINADALCRKYIYPLEYQPYVEKYSAEYGVDKYLVYAVIKTESGFRPEAESDVGARGLMQLMEDAFDWVQYRMNDESGITYDDMFIAEHNIRCGTYLLSLLYSEYNDEETALAAYFSGRGQVNAWLADKEYSSDGKTLDKIPSASSNHYVHKVMTAYRSYTNLYEK